MPMICFRSSPQAFPLDRHMIATRPSLLLLDEPMAGLSPLESQEMIDLLAKLKGKVTIVLVEHDMDAVLATVLAFIAHCTLHGYARAMRCQQSPHSCSNSLSPEALSRSGLTARQSRRPGSSILGAEL